MSRALRVLSFESRKAAEMKSLIERHGGIATIAPVMREIPLGMTSEIRTFLDRLSDGTIDIVILMTGVGAEALLTAVETEFPRDEFLQLLQQRRIVVRGPKPFATLKKWGVRIDAKAQEPNTWREVVTAVTELLARDSGLEDPGAESARSQPLAGLRIAVQEYGEPASELHAALESLGATVLPVPVYRWDLPDDVSPVIAAFDTASRDGFDVSLFTTAQHIVHTVRIAQSLDRRDDWLNSLRRTVIASIGPTASSRLRDFGLPVDIEPDHPHMGQLVRTALESAPDLLSTVRTR